MFGYAPMEAIGRSIEIVIPPERAGEEQTILERIARGERLTHFETERVRKDGSRITISATISPIRDAAGRIVGASKIARDITAQREAERALRASEERLRFSEAVLREAGHIAKVGGWHFDPLTGEGYWTEEVARIHDLPAGAPISVAEGLKYYRNESRVAIERAVKAAIERAEPFDLELEIQTAARRTKWIRTIGHPVVENDRVVRVRGAFQDITDRRQAEEFRARMGGIIETMTEACLALDAEWRFVFLNPSAERLLGTKREDALGRTLWEVVPRLVGTPIEDQYRRVMRDRVAATFEVFSPMAHRWVDVRLFPSSGGIAAFVLDIDDRKLAEQRLRLFRHLMDHSGECIEVVDPTTMRVVDVNDTACRLHGYAREEYLRLTIPEIAPAVDAAHYREIVAQLRTVGRMRIEHGHRRKDGSEFPVEVGLTLVTFEREYVVAVARDITERKRADEALRATEERFREVVETINEVFWMTDMAKQQVLYVSPGYERIWGRSCESLYATSASWLASIHPDDRPRVLDALPTQPTGGYDETYRIIRPDGTVRWVRDVAYPVVEGTGRVMRVVGVAEDVTERKRLEEQFRQAQKMEAIGTLAGGIAHDFNNILAAISGYAELARAEAAGRPEAEEYLAAILNGSTRAADLVRQILAFSRRTEHERKPIQIRHVVAEALKLLRASLPATIEFGGTFASHLPLILADPTEVHQVVMNLCTNAAHAMRDQPGLLEVSLANFTVEADFAAAHPGLRPGPHVLLSVRDTGHGMDAETVSRIFEPFFTTKAPGEGTGLGLAVVHGIMQSHEGAVTVYSHPGQGTTFHLYFPADAGTAAETVVAPAEVPRGHGEAILYVDDEQVLATLGKKILERLGYRVETQTNPARALEVVRADAAGFRLVITDQMMPLMSGTELASRIHTLRPDLPIILITGFTATLTAENVRSLGVGKLLLKPLSVEALGAATAAALVGAS